MARVLLTGFCAVPGPRRAGVQLRHVIRALTPYHSVDLLVAREGDQAYVERQGAVRVLRVPTTEVDLRAQVQSFQRALKRQLDGADYDVVHCRDSWAGLAVLEARKRLGYAMVYDLARSPLGETTGDPELDAQYARDEDACIAAADMVLAPTAAAVKALQARPHVPGAPTTITGPDRIALSAPGVDVDRFDWDDAPVGGPPRILYVGSVDPGRGVRVLVRAMAAIVREVDARLVIAGSMAPKFDQPLRDGIRELGLTDQVEVLGPVDHDQLPALLATATVCVVPAASDLTPSPIVVFPTKILEYMACRRAIVAPRRETLAPVVENNREALLFEAGDPIDLARKVLRLLGEPLLRERLAGNAYDRVRRELTASAARRQLKRAYDKLSEKFAGSFLEARDDDAPKVELLADDDFEATVFEEAPAPPPPPVDTQLSKLRAVQPLEEALASLGAHDLGDAGTGSESAIAPPAARDDETMERIPIPASSGASAWSDEAEPEDLDAELLIDEGTPVEGVAAAAPPAAVVETTFVAGEIDVPARPHRERPDHTSAIELTATSGVIAPLELDPDTGSRTPPIEGR
ncbi:MAG TPA: glycosyltransferase family 4 protein [Kofleriaceae bacterium]